MGVAGGPAGIVWHGAPASSVPTEWARHVRSARSDFENAIDDAFGKSSQVAVVLIDLGVVRLAQRLPEAMSKLEERVRNRLRSQDHLGLVGEDQLAVLMVDRSDADVVELAERLAPVFDEPFVFSDGRVQPLHGTVVWVSGHGDLLWRAFYENAAAVAREHHMIFSEGVFGSPGMNAARVLEDLLIFEEFFARPMGMEAVHLDVPNLRQIPGAKLPPRRPPTGQIPIRLEGREAGWLRWWTAPGENAPDHPQFYTSLSTALSETLQRLVHMEAMSEVASRDPLTGLLNRRGLHDRMSSMPGGFAVALVDVDDFKAVNTELGLAGGDGVLVEIASVLSQGRQDDIVARWGGEEFLLVLPNASTSDASGRLQRMLDATQGRVLANGKQVSFSCGVASAAAAAGFEEAVAEADERLRRAKATGKARVLAS
jgi:diguanylate cyclase (GGDEF)-like protein